jgi:hypothetical protein
VILIKCVRVDKVAGLKSCLQLLKVNKRTSNWPFAGTLHVGDEIREINGVGVHGQTVEALQKMLVCIKHVLLLGQINNTQYDGC